MPSQEEIRAAMALYDTNGDGQLSPDELKAIMCRPIPGGTLRTEGEVDSLVRSFDKNGDGMLSMEEHLRMRGRSWA
jgi:Ca2+-binding EF-hand superfamily protein